VARFKIKIQVEVWHQKWNALEHKEEEDISEYTTRFKKIYKRVDSLKRILIRTIVCKFINSLSLKYVKLLMIIGPSTLNEAIKAAMDVEASQKVKARKRDQAYIVKMIEEFRHEVHNL